ncbi:MAG: metal ABC transporter permease [Candidatus Kerfeldbacteria bacterium RIFOXYA2_FULL_38_24]|uniref:Metal ABC transporter permease n=1 Tax=Candidatus Kerfeldbacteria bacterium RIFOXYB2_FULL_38_14 TaxID=1798547 RepID=A0A1G2BJ67_9BACT|nr:MAG: metal ABC transporter permease [Candidatus Kerfeldbacteria bacterium RIFOXYA2_FULL_38_24]OGY88340.1 MAG: metal ABC transporter permease [Candidatus Kerfeldbacteria bacterium RIFOXYB2_FULL_38_14]OGY89702.1 MAG: metal ABC transporter permease [Candidatus Kerfeldbacteria bacterium RIFOXYC2_FULL_38_9]
MLDFLNYAFMIRGLEIGVLIGLIAPLIGIFLVLRRYSLMADTLAHVSLVGVAFGLLTGISPIISALVTSSVASLLIERLRYTKRVYGESALAIFLSGSLAIAVILINFAHGFSVDLASYLFGSIITTSQADVWITFILGLVVAGIIFGLYKELVYISFDEEAAQVSGVPVRGLNILLIILSAVTIALSIPVVGVLLISALLVLPVVTALQLKLSFKKTLLWSEIFSVGSVLSGMILAWYLNLSGGAAIILVALACFVITFIFSRKR